jgi:hypothetical protein
MVRKARSSFKGRPSEKHLPRLLMCDLAGERRGRLVLRHTQAAPPRAASAVTHNSLRRRSSHADDSSRRWPSLPPGRQQPASMRRSLSCIPLCDPGVARLALWHKVHADRGGTARVSGRQCGAIAALVCRRSGDQPAPGPPMASPRAILGRVGAPNDHFRFWPDSDHRQCPLLRRC